MEKKCKVVLLPTTISNIYKSKEGKLYYWASPNLETSTAQHLYIIEINGNHKDGDYVLDVIDKVYEKFGENSCITKDSHLIIATTDPDLIKEGIASIDDEFIKSYCNNPVEEVLVIYEEITTNTLIGLGIDSMNHKLKLSSNGSISIKPVEETWNDLLCNVDELNSKKYNGIYDMQELNDVLYIIQENYEVPKKK